ncbi:MAG: hypothetical protein WBH04_08675 [Albidovulum sp.]
MPHPQRRACEAWGLGYKSFAMNMIFDMDDRARLPWRFFGATLTVLACL